MADEKKAKVAPKTSKPKKATVKKVFDEAKEPFEKIGELSCFCGAYIVGINETYNYIKAASYGAARAEMLQNELNPYNNLNIFETLLNDQDAIVSDELNHASIIDGVRLCKAKRYRYKNNDMADLEQKLIEADEAGARIKLIATDGVFSMDGIICNLKGICDLADKYNGYHLRG